MPQPHPLPAGVATRSAVPVIDLSTYDRSRPAQRRDAAELMDHACRTAGAFVVTGHGVDPALVQRASDATRGFFDLPDSVKQRYAPTGSKWRGWFPRTVAGTSVRMRETFEVGRYDSAAALEEAGYGPEWADKAEPNRWPSQPPGFRATWTTYYAAMEELGDHLLSLLAPALDLPTDWFADKFDRQTSFLAGHRYPPQFASAREAVMRMDAHTDVGTLSLIYQDEGPGGLQVLDRSGEWLDVPADADHFVVCIGEMLAQWTNDRWTATPHRVRPLGERDPARGRTSMVFFQHPNFDAELACLPSCVTDERPARYTPVRAGDWSHRRMTRDDPA